MQKTRLYFIDIARSIAILLMLEGHFVDNALMDVYRDTNNDIYNAWLFVRGFTSPIFLTITGIVFTYLLIGNNHLEYFKNNRIKKGYKRVVELLFWGYVVQVYAFHVLQCIGIGILTILILYGIYKAVKIIPLWVYFFFAGTIIFSSYIVISSWPKEYYWPESAPIFIQNMFHGKYSIFPILPRMGYTMYGAMIGVILYTYKSKVKEWSFILSVFLIGAFLYFFLKDLLLILDGIFAHPIYHLYKVDWLYECLGMVLIILSILITLEKFIGEIKPNLFLKIGQNTLTIYILHMVLLYGSITGFGINRVIHKNLTPWQIVLKT
ncbi:MAG: heparan-alpha-glucosaminide N-acetyltransferase domain-containing protein [Flavobacteriia bacterium]|nr:heparan-alpha-glucosaminide N-acetyltransferase domain-containing protein [Flavobacteriia bacterium]